MKKIHLSITIKAPVEKVWQTTIGKDTYPLWTEVFMPGSNAVGTWEKGSKMKFVGANEQGNNDGMVSEIAENKPSEYLSIKHLGFISNGVEDTTSDAAKAWAPSFENYTFKKTDDQTTEFTVDMDAADEYYEYFLKTWPKALEKLKEVSETGTSSTIGITTWVKAPIEKVWEYYNSPEHITKWAFADDSWEAPYAENDLREGGKFKTHMGAKDKSAEFDFTGTYTKIVPHELIAYTMDDGRKALVTFIKQPTSVQVIVVFDMEHENSREMQRGGWQAILNNFKKHVEQS